MRIHPSFRGHSMASNKHQQSSPRILFLVILSAFIFGNASASDKDSNVIISGAKENYTFNYNKKQEQVEVKHSLATTYTCQSFRTRIPIVEFYDDKTTIDDATVYVNGKKDKNVVPKYEYYSVDNIFFSDSRVCYINLPLEKKGSSSDVYFEKTITDPRYFTTIYFSEGLDISNKVVTISVPRWMKVELKELNFANRNILKTSVYNSKEDADVITYTIKDMAARKTESHSPGGSYTEPHLLVLAKSAEPEGKKFTYFSNLNEQYAWYHSLTNNLENNLPVIKAKADEITNGVTDDFEKIKKIYYWMHDNIRYIAFEDGIAGFKPAKADEVLRKKYGDCKGMAHLTKELLKAVGFDARFCWIGTNHIAYNYSTPSLAVDNHMITALLYKGKTYYLDATENYIGFNEYAERIQGREVLIENGDKYILNKVPVASHLQNQDLEKSVLTIKGVHLQGLVIREWKGEEKENIFTQLNSIKKEKSNDAFIKFLSDDNNEYQISDFSTSDLSDYDKTLHVKYQVDHNNAVSAFGNDLYVDIDRRKDFRDFTFDLKEREKDYWFGYKVNMETEVLLNVPSEYTVTAFPPPVLIVNPDYEFSAAITTTSGRVKYSKKIIIKNTRLSRSKFEQWNKDIEKLKAFYNEQLVLSKK